MTTNKEIICACGGGYLTFGEWPAHFASDNHQRWFLQNPDNIKQIYINCGCGFIYNYQNAHPHFRLKSHREWEAKDLARHDQVLIVCKCGDIIRYKQREFHNKTHLMPAYTD